MAESQVDDEERTAAAGSFWRRRVVRPLSSLLAAGATPRKLSWSLGLGTVIGVLPFPGATTVLCGTTATVLRLNHPAIQIANYLVTPLHLALLLPFLRAGEWLFGAPPLPFSAGEIARLFELEGLAASRHLLAAQFRALAVWLPLAALVAPAIALGSRPLLARLARRNGSGGRSA